MLVELLHAALRYKFSRDTVYTDAAIANKHKQDQKVNNRKKEKERHDTHRHRQ